MRITKKCTQMAGCECDSARGVGGYVYALCICRVGDITLRNSASFVSLPTRSGPAFASVCVREEVYACDNVHHNNYADKNSMIL